MIRNIFGILCLFALSFVLSACKDNPASDESSLSQSSVNSSGKGNSTASVFSVSFSQAGWSFQKNLGGVNYYTNTITAVPANGSGSYSYEWRINGVLQAASTGNYVVLEYITWQQNVSVSCTVTDLNLDKIATRTQNFSPWLQ
ncbi:MAG: hypothetical protein IAF08_08560 [Rhizobacter sp.]|nr:hypothetical protein [Chlorobiales bacterium]